MTTAKGAPLMIDKLDMFIALAREEHFGRAAQSMGVTQPTLSARLVASFGTLHRAALARPILAGLSSPGYPCRAILARAVRRTGGRRSPQGRFN